MVCVRCGASSCRRLDIMYYVRVPEGATVRTQSCDAGGTNYMFLKIGALILYTTLAPKTVISIFTRYFYTLFENTFGKKKKRKTKQKPMPLHISRIENREIGVRSRRVARCVVRTVRVYARRDVKYRCAPALGRNYKVHEMGAYRASGRSGGMLSSRAA